ncbi:MAG: hypothetical protein GX624_00335 [Actinobacteria bacterium]|nr:hypothetical protein [Actinomycetota bacterium]
MSETTAAYGNAYLFINGTSSYNEYNGGAHATYRGAQLWSSVKTGAETLPERTEYADYHPCGEPRSTTLVDVVLEEGADPQDLTSHASYDAFGHLLTATDPLGTVTEENDYDAAGRLISQTGPESATGPDGGAPAYSQTQHYVYDALGQVVRSWKTSSDPALDGKLLGLTENAYSPSGLLLREAHLDGFSAGQAELWHVSHLYDGSGRKVESNDSRAGGLPARIDYDRHGNVVASWPEGRSAYNFHGAERIAYDENDRKTASWEPGGDLGNELPSEELPTSEFTYDADGRLVRTEERTGSWSVTLYDAAGRGVARQAPTGSWDAEDDPFALQRELTDYDLAGSAVREFDSSGVKTEHLYDLAGRETEVTLLTPEPGDGGEKPDDGVTGLDNARTVTSYNSAGWTLLENGIEAVTTATCYDAAGRVTSSTVGDVKTSVTYNSAGAVLTTAVGPPSGDPARIVSTYYDSFGGVLREVGGPVGNEAARSETSYVRDSQARVTEAVKAVGSSGPSRVVFRRQFAYGASEDETAVIQSLSYGSPASGSLQPAEDAELITSVTNVDVAGRDQAASARRLLRRNLLTHPSFELDEDADGMADGWTIFETAVGAPVFSASGAAYSGAAAQRVTYAGQPGDAASIFARTLTPDGSLAAGDACTASINVAGAPANSGCNLTLYLYAKNAANQSIGSPVSTSVPIPTSSSYARYSVAYSSLPEGTDHVIFYVYVIGIGPSSQIDLRLDGALIERSATLGSYFDGASASAGWEGAAHASTSVLRSAEEVSCATTGRDPAGRITEVGLSLQGAAALTSGFQYSANNRLTRQTGAGFDPAAENQVYFYQAMTGWLLRRKMDFASAAGLHGDIDAGYTYAESGRLKAAGGVTYTFNGGGALTKVTGGSTTDTFTYSQRQKVTAMKEDGATVATYQWDNANDRRASEKNASGTVTRRYTYGADGMLAQLEQGQTTLDFVYGADGQRLSMVRTGGSSTTTTTYTYDGLSLLALSGVNGAQKWSVSYLYNASGVPYAGYYEDLGDGGTTPRSAWFAIVTDLRGDVVELLDRNGAPFASYRYSVWGQPQGGTSGVCSRATTAISDADLASDIAARQVLRYCGYVYDAASGLYYCSARYYDPETRQWTSRDPAKADGVESAYQYAAGSPTLARDPSGERPDYGSGYIARYNAATHQWYPVRYGRIEPWRPSPTLLLWEALWRPPSWTLTPAATAAVHGANVKACPRNFTGSSSASAIASGWGAVGGFMMDFAESSVNDIGFLTGCPWAEGPFGDNENANNALAAGIMILDPFAGGGGLRSVGAGAREAAVALRGVKAAKGGIGPVLKGEAGVKATIREIEAAGGQVLAEQPTIYAGGIRTRPDLYVQLPNGKHAFIEVKTGPFARLSKNQAAAFPILMAQGGRGAGLRAAEGGIEGAIPAIPVWVVHRP